METGTADAIEGIVCPICGGPLHVTETRPNIHSYRRRRACLDQTCDGRVTTVEVIAPVSSNGKPRANARGDDLVVLPRELVERIAELAAMARR